MSSKKQLTNISIYEDTSINPLHQEQFDRVRRSFNKGELNFSVIDVIEVLTESVSAGTYWEKMKSRSIESGGFKDLSPKWGQLKLTGRDGKKYPTDCANMEVILRIIQSIPSQKAEPFKQWMAKVAKERLEEELDPEKAINRSIDKWKSQGRSSKWINNRLKVVEKRNFLTSEWKIRDIKDNEYGILTNIIHESSFDISIKDHKDIKCLKNENLRDHMDDLELAIINIAEITTERLHKVNDSYGFKELSKDARTGGELAGDFRKNLESKLCKPVVSSQNFLGINLDPKLTNKKG